MEQLDLRRPRFQQQQVLQLVPALTAEMLHNWVARKIVVPDGAPRPGRQPKILYSGVGAIALAFTAEIAPLIGPRAAFDLATREISKHALELHSSYPAAEEDGRLTWTIFADAPEHYHRAYVFKHAGRHVVLIQKSDLGSSRALLPRTMLSIEIDFLIIDVLNRIYRLIAGQPLGPEEFQITRGGERDAEAEARFGPRFERIGQLDTPGDENE